jgi:hypothetical protein
MERIEVQMRMIVNTMGFAAPADTPALRKASPGDCRAAALAHSSPRRIHNSGERKTAPQQSEVKTQRARRMLDPKASHDIPISRHPVILLASGSPRSAWQENRAQRASRLGIGASATTAACKRNP